MARYHSGRQPRISCPGCGRPVAARRVAGVIGQGTVVDHKNEPHSLVLCDGSMQRVDLPQEAAYQRPIPRLMRQLHHPGQMMVFADVDD